jgi:uncharacterized membrane protein YkvA (DUF1232 family)
VGSSPTPGTVSFGQWLLISAAVVLAIYAVAVLALAAGGRRADATALARFVPDCAVLFRRLLADPRVDWWRKAVLVGAVVYLASPIDLVPDFIPVAGQVDDVIVVALALRVVLRGSGPSLLAEHWPGPRSSLAVISRLAY